jgi:hypothetical protein
LRTISAFKHGPARISHPDEQKVDSVAQHPWATRVGVAVGSRSYASNPATTFKTSATAAAIYTTQMVATGNDADNRAAVRSVATADLDLVGLGIRAPHRDADAILRGLKRHP